MRSLEHGKRQEVAQKIKKDSGELLDHQFLTPVEHLMFGSSEYGLAFFVNSPLTVEAGVDLEAINQRRSEMTDDRKNFLLKLNDRYVYLEIKLLPLTQEMLASEQPQMTFQVLGIKEVTSGDDGEKPVEFPDDLEQIIIDKISKRQNQIKDILAQGKTFEYL